MNLSCQNCSKDCLRQSKSFLTFYLFLCTSIRHIERKGKRAHLHLAKFEIQNGHDMGFTSVQFSGSLIPSRLV